MVYDPLCNLNRYHFAVIWGLWAIRPEGTTKDYNVAVDHGIVFG